MLCVHNGLTGPLHGALLDYSCDGSYVHIAICLCKVTYNNYYVLITSVTVGQMNYLPMQVATYN